MIKIRFIYANNNKWIGMGGVKFKTKKRDILHA